MLAIGVSGDGDTGAIGIGQFVHLMRRNLPLVYIIEDNGCYGLTKGQFSPTADLGSTLKNGVVNDLPRSTRARSPSSWARRWWRARSRATRSSSRRCSRPRCLTKGTAMLDVLSPCVTFNDHEGSTKSYSYVKDHEEPLSDVSFVPFFEDIAIEHEEGTTREVALHDGSRIVLHKLDRDYDPTDKVGAMRVLHETASRGEYATGLLYIDAAKRDFCSLMNLVGSTPCDAASLGHASPRERARRADGEAAVTRHRPNGTYIRHHQAGRREGPACRSDSAARRRGGLPVRALRLQHLTKTKPKASTPCTGARPFFGSLTDSCRRAPAS
jgi:hypothetical protein